MKAKIHGNYNGFMKSGDIVTVYPDKTADGIDIYRIPIGECYLCEKDGLQSYIPVTQIEPIAEIDKQSETIEYEKIDWNYIQQELIIDYIKVCKSNNYGHLDSPCMYAKEIVKIKKFIKDLKYEVNEQEKWDNG